MGKYKLYILICQQIDKGLLGLSSSHITPTSYAIDEWVAGGQTIKMTLLKEAIQIYVFHGKIYECETESRQNMKTLANDEKRMFTAHFLKIL